MTAVNSEMTVLVTCVPDDPMSVVALQLPLSSILTTGSMRMKSNNKNYFYGIFSDTPHIHPLMNMMQTAFQ